MGARGPKPTPAWRRVLAKTALMDQGFDSPCLIFHGYINPESGYGQIHDSESSQRTRAVHVVMYEHSIGPVPLGLQLDHLCRVRACCEPTHLEAVTPEQNVRRGIAPRVLLSVANSCEQGHDLLVTSVPSGRFRRCGVCRDEYRSRYYTLMGA